MEILKSLARSTAKQRRNDRVDLVGELPPELAELILSKLDTSNLCNAALVSRRWLAICKSTARLRRQVQQHLRRQYLLGVVAPGARGKLDDQLDVISIMALMLVIIHYARRLISTSLK